jgi:hypothetical protein
VVVHRGGSSKDPDAKGAPEVAEAAEGQSRSAGVSGDPTGSVANWQDSAELAKELVMDLRSELTRIDARAAAGVALSAAVLLGLVGQTSMAAPIYWVAIVAAVLLTLAVLLFLVVLLPSPNLLIHQVVLTEPPDAPLNPLRARGAVTPTGPLSRDRRAAASDARDAELTQLQEKGRQLASQLEGQDRTEYHAMVAIQVSSQLRHKRRLLLLAFASGSLGVAFLALGATWALLLGWR